MKYINNKGEVFEGESDLSIIRHTTSHILAHAIKRIYGNKAKIAIGPSIENGFYYDIDFDEKISEEDLNVIEEEMKKIIKENLRINSFTLSRDEAIKLMEENDEIYKMELIKDLPIDSEITFFKQGEFVDLCLGPHLVYTKAVKAFKLLNITGAYWRGDEKNKMLTRIYGTAFENKEELDKELIRREEAKKRDHRRLGRELDLFCFSDLVGPGLPLFTQKGVTIKEELQKEVEKICRKYGFQKVSTPHLAKIKLFETSGHATKFEDELFHVSSIKGHEYVMKPVQCPGHTQIYASKPRSYKDLPIRYMESEKQYRAELSGAVSGLSRVYAITCEDGHSFCRIDQVKQEVINMVNIIKDFYTRLGLWENHWVSLSLRDNSHPEKYIGSIEDWQICEDMLQEVSDELGLNAKRCEGEAALYGPKLDFMFTDAMGREIQIPTVQLDFATPKRFDLSYIDSNGLKVNPVMVHRAILGSYERFMVLLIEHYAGIFPLWLSPIQVKILPITENEIDYAKEIEMKLQEAGYRVEVNFDDQKIGYKVREAIQEKVPYMIILGKNEIENNLITVRDRKGEDIKDIKVEDFITLMNEVVKKELKR